MSAECRYSGVSTTALLRGLAELDKVTVARDDQMLTAILVKHLAVIEGGDGHVS